MTRTLTFALREYHAFEHGLEREFSFVAATGSTTSPLGNLMNDLSALLDTL